MVAMDQLPRLGAGAVTSYRLIHSRFPPISLFDDVASADEFDALFELQRISNPRLINEAGQVELIPTSEIPFGIRGCSYATGPFTHVNPEGSRFSDGSYGVLYLADSTTTALAEVKHHQGLYWSQVTGLQYERFVFRGLRFSFEQEGLLDARQVAHDDPVYAPDNYTASRLLGAGIRQAGLPGIQYRSVRHSGGTCWGLMSPARVSDVVQTGHYEMIWNHGSIASVNEIQSCP